MNIKNIPEETIEKIKEYDSLQRKMYRLFNELQSAFNDDYCLVDNFTIENEPHGNVQKDGSYIEETKCGEDSGWGSLYVPVEDGKFICISYCW